MITKLARLFASLALAAGAIALVMPASSLAATARSVSETVAKPSAASIMAMPGYDTDRKDDDIVQVSNLKVTEIAYVSSVQGGTEPFAPGGLYAVVTASTDFGITCTRYQTEVSTKALACNQIRPAQYRIHVTDRTILLGVNRTRLTIDQLAVGDRINAYGYFDRDGSYMDALILRDLDKPVTPKTVQLENYRVYSIVPDANGDIRLLVASNAGTCYDWATSKRARLCPQGMTTANASASDAGVAASLNADKVMRAYWVVVPSSAKVLNAKRVPVKLSTIRVGDTINAYGSMRDEDTLYAQVVRITSSSVVVEPLVMKNGGNMTAFLGAPASFEFAVSGGTAPYAWSLGKGNIPTKTVGLPPGMSLVTQTTVNCFMAPCPQPATNTAQIVGTPTQTGIYAFSVIVWDGANRYVGNDVVMTVSRMSR